MASLFLKRWNGSLNKEEKKFLKQWLAESPEHKELYKRLTRKHRLKHLGQFEENNPGISERLFAIDNDVLDEDRQRPQKRSSISKVACCVSLAAAVAACVILYLKLDRSAPDPGNKVVLRLADGTRISPDTVKSYLLIDQGNNQLIIHNDELRYIPLPGKSPGKKQDAFNEVLVPACKQFRLVLPDRSEVSLNAASSIRFSVTAANGIRRCELTGEGYFHIQPVYAGKNKIPFVVKAKTPAGLSGTVIVTGTKFNINAYGDEPVITTTLIEGRVKVVCAGKSIWLSPGEESHMGEAQSIKMKRDTMENVLAWKDGGFSFNDTPVSDVVNELSRRYGMKIEFIGDPADRIVYEGRRPEKIDSVLKVICLVKSYSYVIEGDRVMLIKDR